MPGGKGSSVEADDFRSEEREKKNEGMGGADT